VATASCVALAIRLQLSGSGQTEDSRTTTQPLVAAASRGYHHPCASTVPRTLPRSSAWPEIFWCNRKRCGTCRSRWHAAASMIRSDTGAPTISRWSRALTASTALRSRHRRNVVQVFIESERAMALLVDDLTRNGWRVPGVIGPASRPSRAAAWPKVTGSASCSRSREPDFQFDLPQGRLPTGGGLRKYPLR
jgi:hypothetical protein